MARKTYRLTDATYQALIRHEASIADEMDCDPSYIYGIKNQKHPDPYPKFREIYRAAVRTGAPHEHWDNDMAAIRASVDAAKAVAETMHMVLAKIQADARSTQTLVESLEDGVLTEREVLAALRDLKAVKKNTELLENALLRRLAEIREVEAK